MTPVQNTWVSVSGWVSVSASECLSWLPCPALPFPSPLLFTDFGLCCICLFLTHALAQCAWCSGGSDSIHEDAAPVSTLHRAPVILSLCLQHLVLVVFFFNKSWKQAVVAAAAERVDDGFSLPCAFMIGIYLEKRRRKSRFQENLSERRDTVRELNKRIIDAES